MGKIYFLNSEYSKIPPVNVLRAQGRYKMTCQCFRDLGITEFRVIDENGEGIGE